MQEKHRIFSPSLGENGTTEPRKSPKLYLLIDPPFDDGTQSEFERRLLRRIELEQSLAHLAPFPPKRGRFRPRLAVRRDLICAAPEDLPTVWEVYVPAQSALVTFPAAEDSEDKPSESDAPEHRPPETEPACRFAFSFENGRIPREELHAFKAFLADLPEEVGTIVFRESSPFSFSSGVAAALLLAFGCDDLPVWSSHRYRPDVRTFEAVASLFGIRVDPSMRDHRVKENDRARKKKP